ncbi:MAG TPA: hypothetical protein VKJ65_10305 [Phycisphaerae bacterium]|nr:hypothetical protein [Phycisphaerae bacterium]
MTKLRVFSVFLFPLILVGTAILGGCSAGRILPESDQSLPTNFVPGGVYVLQCDVLINWEYNTDVFGTHYFLDSFDHHALFPDSDTAYQNFLRDPQVFGNERAGVLTKGTQLQYVGKGNNYGEAGPSPNFDMKVLTGPYAGVSVDAFMATLPDKPGFVNSQYLEPLTK